jgi:hypothetical protein
MLERALTTERCAAIISLLLSKPGWNRRRIAKVVGAPMEYINRIQSGKQSFQMADVEALSAACRQSPAMLVFATLLGSKVSSELKGLHDLALKEMESHTELEKSLRNKQVKRRRSSTRAA